MHSLDDESLLPSWLYVLLIEHQLDSDVGFWRILCKQEVFTVVNVDGRHDVLGRLSAHVVEHIELHCRLVARHAVQLEIEDRERQGACVLDHDCALQSLEKGDIIEATAENTRLELSPIDINPHVLLVPHF